MINCLVLDDEEHAIDVLRHYIEQTGTLRMVAGCNDPVQAFQLLREQPIDLIFLDIHMPKMSGLDLARNIDKKFKVVLCTAYPDYALEGFELDVLDYLVKPIPLARFMKTVQKAAECFAAPADDFIVVKTGTRGSMAKINIGDILCIEGMKNYVAIHHDNQKTLALLSMKELEERLPSGAFMRVHRSFIVSVRHITAIEGNEILLRGVSPRVLLGESYRQRFFEVMRGKLIGRP